MLRRPPPEALLIGFGPGSLDFVLRVWVGYDGAMTVIPVPPQQMRAG